MIPKFTGELYCGLLWQKNVLSKSRNQQNNPYVTGQRPICGSGLVSHTGANFKILLLMMKFVYKLAESKDTEVVYDIVKKAGLPFPMKPLKQVQDQLLNDQHGLSMRYMMDDFTKDKIYNFSQFSILCPLEIKMRITNLDLPDNDLDFVDETSLSFKFDANSYAASNF